MRILDTPPRLLDSVDYYSAAPNGGGRQSAKLEITQVCVDTLPPGLSMLIAASDLQGRAIDENGEPGELLGSQLAGYLCRRGICPTPDTTGVLLSGDLYSEDSASRRGSTGDVMPVWRSFATHYQWVVGVLGNHDLLPQDQDLTRTFPNAAVLDGNAVERSGLCIGGVGGIVGKLTKPNRKAPALMMSLLEGVNAQRPDIILTHESPRAYEGRRGNNAIRDWFAGLPSTDEVNGTPLLVCGHTRWRQPLVTYGNGAQALNVDHRVVLLQAA